MVTNILMDVLKTDFSQKQTDFDPKYSSKDTSNSFMRVFETANKSFNFNKEKMEKFSTDDTGENHMKKLSSRQEQEIHYHSHENASENMYHENPINNKNKSAYSNDSNERSNIKNNKPDKEVNHSGKKTEVTEIKKEDKAQKASLTTEDRILRDSKEASSKAEKNKAVESGEKAENIQNQAISNSKQAISNSKEEKPTDKQSQQSTKTESVKDTTGKLLLEKAKPEEKNQGVAADKKTVPGAEGKDAEGKKEVKIAQNNPEKQAISTNSKSVSTEKAQDKMKETISANNREITPQKAGHTAEEAKPQQNTEKNKPEIQNNLEIKEKNTEKKPEAREAADNKVKNHNPKDDGKIPLPPNSRQVEIKEDLKLENIKILANSEAQKTAGDSMNKQGQQNLAQESKTGMNQTASVDNASRQADIQKTAQFDRILNSKHTESTQKSILNQVKNASSQLGNGKSEVSINLRPENLGKVNINLVSQKGELTARITAENNQVKEMLVKGLETLRQSLSEQGINVNRVAVNVQDSSSSKGDANFDNTAKFDENGNSSETGAESGKDENPAENDHDPAEAESYDFEENSEEPDKPGIRNLTGNVDYKV